MERETATMARVEWRTKEKRKILVLSKYKQIQDTFNSVIRQERVQERVKKKRDTETEIEAKKAVKR